MITWCYDAECWSYHSGSTSRGIAVTEGFVSPRQWIDHWCHCGGGRQTLVNTCGDFDLCTPPQGQDPLQGSPPLPVVLGRRRRHWLLRSPVSGPWLIFAPRRSLLILTKINTLSERRWTISKEQRVILKLTRLPRRPGTTGRGGSPAGGCSSFGRCAQINFPGVSNLSLPPYHLILQ